MEKQPVMQAGESVRGKSGGYLAVKKAVSWLIPLAIGVGVAVLVFHKTRFEQQADGVMSPLTAAELGLLRHDEVGHVGRVWFLRSRDGWFQYRAIYRGLGGRVGVIHAVTRVDIAKVCATLPPEDCRLLRPYAMQIAK
ncbi:hypothetical protein [Paraburkholderia humisilvae]|uniref:Uncharacterized protein n=1 Tax=Paraburkholderia humisilvae TaxID=627669 RepID=A0A6J5DP39_9BURK|nr:hypothetical protein [Paraburkholderia humisilvae]CAB3754596.1 hypothetical protein LMG29542_02393 [Paraburkholderia humisilvae]